MKNLSFLSWVYAIIAVSILLLIVAGLIVNDSFGVFCECLMVLSASGFCYELSTNKEFMEGIKS